MFLMIQGDAVRRTIGSSSCFNFDEALFVCPAAPEATLLVAPRTTAEHFVGGEVGIVRVRSPSRTEKPAAVQTDRLLGASGLFGLRLAYQ